MRTEKSLMKYSQAPLCKVRRNKLRTVIPDGYFIVFSVTHLVYLPFVGFWRKEVSNKRRKFCNIFFHYKQERVGSGIKRVGNLMTRRIQQSPSVVPGVV